MTIPGACHRPTLDHIVSNILSSILARAALALLILFAVGGLIAPLTFSAGIWLGILPFIGILGIASLGQHLVVQQRGFDLSVAGVMSLSAVVISSQLPLDASAAEVVIYAIGVLVLGTIIGVMNGVLVSKFRIPPIVTTIGMNAILVGFALYLSGNVPSSSPQLLTDFANSRVWYLPTPFVIMIVISAITAFVMAKSVIGRRFVAVGVSPEASKALAISVSRYRIGTYALAGFLFSLAGLLLAGYLTSPAVQSGMPYMLTTLAAVIVGSNPLNGDRGSILATMIGAVFLSYLNQLVLVLGFDYATQAVVQAVIVLAGVAVPNFLSGNAVSGKGRVVPGHSPAAVDAANSLLTLRGVSKSFGPVVALSDVSLSVEPGRVHAIVGENGAGKSTMINVMAGVFAPSGGDVFLDGKPVTGSSPRTMRELGISVAYQHPTLPPDLTVLECLQIVSEKFRGADGPAHAQALMDRVATDALSVDPGTRVSELNIAQRHVCEIVRAIATNPRVLVLDEPTEPFREADVKKLFALVRELRDDGTAIIYISHRLHEVEEIADRVSVLRDGRLIETRDRQDFSHDEIINLIVGRALDQVFPPKRLEIDAGDALLSFQHYGGARFNDVSLDVQPGEIVGLAGVEGQGQRDFIRALAGLDPSAHGTVHIGGRPATIVTVQSARHHGIRFITDDRHLEGNFGSLSIRENISLGQLPALSRGGVMSTGRELQLATGLRDDLNIRSQSVEANINTLSGGNQQKVLVSRETAADPLVLLVDEPTKGVDIGSRSEIYHKLRAMAESGVPVVVLSSDGVELEGLCDRVLVFSRGTVATELTGQDVTDEKITAANLQARGARKGTYGAQSEAGSWSWLKNKVQKDGFAALALLVLSAIVVIGTYGFNDRFLSPYNLRVMGMFISVLALVSAAQLLVILISEIDLSVGPMVGLTIVLASFLTSDGVGYGQTFAGVLAILLICTLIGALQGLAVIWLRLPSMVVTLASFFGFQGVSLMLRPTPAGPITENVADFLKIDVVGLPLVIILVALLLLGLERMLKISNLGRAIRAIGSDAPSAYRLGLNRDWLGPLVFAMAGFLTGLSGVVLSAEVGIGTATAGTNYTLMSITAVVVGGAVIGGGRGSFVSVLLAAALIQITWISTSFLRLGAEWQNWEIGIATLAAAALFSMTRKRA